MVDQSAPQVPLGFFQRLLQSMLHKARLVGDGYNADSKSLPEILMFQFGHGDIELPAQPVL